MLDEIIRETERQRRARSAIEKWRSKRDSATGKISRTYTEMQTERYGFDLAEVERERLRLASLADRVWVKGAQAYHLAALSGDF